MFNSTAGSNFNVTAAFDRQNPAASRSFYETRHNVTFSGNLTEKLFGDYGTSVGWTFVARSGRPYSLTFNGSPFNANQSSAANGNLVYLPSGVSDPNISPSSNMAAVQSLVDFANSLKCARKYLGQSIPRNTCTVEWYKDLDLRFSQELPGPLSLMGSPDGLHDKLRAYVMFNNFLNLLNKNWNLQYRRDFGERQVIAKTSGVDAQGRYIITALAGGQTPEARFAADRFINVSTSVWQIKVGLSYDF